MNTCSDNEAAIDELSSLILDFLPGPGPGYAITAPSFQGIASELELNQFWRGNSKAMCVKSLCQNTLKSSPDKFPTLLLKIIQTSKELQKGRNSLSVEELTRITDCLRRMDISVPQLEAAELRSGLPLRIRHAEPTTKAMSNPQLDLRSRLRIDLVTLTRAPLEEQGYELELFLNKMFANFDLRPLSPFRQSGDHIQGTVHISKKLFAVYACWQNLFTEEKIDGLMRSLPLDSHCLLISLHGFPESARNYLASGQAPTRLIACDLRDLFLVLDGGANLEQMIALKLQAAQKGNSFAAMQDLMIG